jgi:hypothetical protein
VAHLAPALVKQFYSRESHSQGRRVLYLTLFCVNQWEEEKYFILFRYWLKSKGTLLGMHRIVFLLDIRLIQKPDTGYPVPGNGRILDIRPDTWLTNYIFRKITNTGKLIKNSFNNYRLLKALNKA